LRCFQRHPPQHQHHPPGISVILLKNIVTRLEISVILLNIGITRLCVSAIRVNTVGLFALAIICS
jgi:hypothetical protein